MAVLKNGAREDINLPPTSRAQPAVTTPFPNVLAAAGRILKSLWKPKRKQILPARFVISEAFFKFNQRFRIVLTHIPYLYVGGWWRQVNSQNAGLRHDGGSSFPASGSLILRCHNRHCSCVLVLDSAAGVNRECVCRTDWL